MGIMTRAVQKRFDEWNGEGYYIAGTPDAGIGFLTGLAAAANTAGVSVTPETAWMNSAIFNGFQILSETISTLPYGVYKHLKPRGREQASDHPLHKLLHSQPNPEMSSQAWREVMALSIFMRGNGYSNIERNHMGDPIAFWPLMASKMKPRRGRADGTDPGTLWYYYWTKDGYIEMAADEVLHIPGFGYDGLGGMSIITAARNAIGLAMAEEKHGENFFRNGAIPGGVLERPLDAPDLGDKGAKNIEDTWYKGHGGLSRSHRLKILEEGMTYKQIGISNEDSQFLESRKFQLAEVARYLNMPTHMLKDMEHAHFNNIEHSQIEFVVFCARPHVTRWEQWVDYKLFDGGTEYFNHFTLDGLLRGDRKSRYDSYHVGRLDGWLNGDDIREMEDINPMPDGKGNIYWMPANMLAAPSEDEASALIPTNTGNQASKRVNRGPSSQTAPRMKLRQTYGRLIGQAAGRYVRREVNDLKRAVEKHLRKRSILSFEDYLEDFYKDHEEFIKREIGPVIRSYAEEVAALAADQVDYELGDKERELADFIEDYIAVIASRHVASSEGQLRSLIEKAAGDQEGLDNAISQRLDEWDERRPSKIERDEQIRANDAVASWIFVAAGFSLVWTTWGAKPCPYCLELSGKIIPAGGTFVKAGEVLNPDEEIEDMRVYGPKGHAPLHGGCVCTVEPA